MRFDWDAVKARRNLAKHGVSFDDKVQSMFAGAAIFEDFAHSEKESRFTAMDSQPKGECSRSRSHCLSLRCVESSARDPRQSEIGNDMPKRNATPQKRKSAHDDYELPAELDSSKLKFIGFGLDAARRHSAPKKVNKARRDPLDDEVDVHSARYLDTGKYFKQKAAEHRFVQLDADVYRDFPTAAEVNAALRLVKQLRQVGVR